jgi:peptidoglycan/xylan/chitin deacetylase (PgdA/CDA1 family)
VIGNVQGASAPRKRLGPPLRRRARQLLLRAGARRQVRPGLRVLTYHLLPPLPIFRSHISAIRSVAEIIDEDEFLTALDNPGALGTGDCKVLLTFDDGYRQHLNPEAFDIVNKLELRPTVFMVAAGVEPELGRPTRLLGGRDPQTLVDASELRAAVDAGWFVGSHTSTHWDCAAGTPEELAREIGGSKEVLEACLGTEIHTFAFPFGKPENTSDNAFDAVRDSGYRAAFTTVRGRIASEPASAFNLPRDVIELWWGPQEISGCLAGALDRAGMGS